MIVVVVMEINMSPEGFDPFAWSNDGNDVHMELLMFMVVQIQLHVIIILKPILMMIHVNTLIQMQIVMVIV